MRLGRSFLALVVGAAFIPLTAAAASAATARASDPITIYAGPGYGFAPIGRLAKGAVVGLSECTPRGTWCHIITDDAPNGWVLGSYLIGSAAKVEATPWRPLVNPFHMFGPRHRWLVP